MTSYLHRFGAVALTFFVALAPVSVRAAEEEEDPFYEGFFAAHILSLTQANLSVGVLGDAVAKGVYEGEQAVNVANAYSQLIAASQKVLLDIAKADDTDEEDATLLKKVAKVAGLIKDQADAVTGIAKGDKEAVAAFGKARDATQKALDAVNKEVVAYFE